MVAALAALAPVGMFAMPAWAALSGSGTSSTAPYLINDEADWETFVSMVHNDPNLGKDKFFKLTGNITINLTYTSIYDEVQQKAFQKSIVEGFKGTLDGDGKTLTFNFTQEVGDFGAAPFTQIEGATIKNLKVAGEISTVYPHAGGIASFATGENTIENCAVSATISTYKTGSVWHGGFVGHNGGTLNFKDCVFNGGLKGTQVQSIYYYTIDCGGFVGENSGTANFENCLVDVNENNTVTRSYTFSNGGTNNFTNAYYTTPLQHVQGKRVYSASDVVADGKTAKKGTITIADQSYPFYIEGTAEITGLPAQTALQANEGPYTPSFIVKFGDTTLVSGTDYSSTITTIKETNTVENNEVVTKTETVTVNGGITETGTYTLTVTLMGDYAGSVSQRFVVSSLESKSYIDAEGRESYSPSAKQVKATDTQWNEGWYYAEGLITIGSRVTVTGNVNLILCDGADLTVNGGINIPSQNTTAKTLHIYGQSNDTGKLTATGGRAKPGIGGIDWGKICIYGGDITATGDNSSTGGAAGIGGDGTLACGTIIISGGKVKATGGIGPGKWDDSLGIKPPVTVNLSWTRPTDSLEASSYGGNVNLKKTFMLKDTNTLATKDNIGGKTIVPAYKVTLKANNGTETTSTDVRAPGTEYTLPACGFTLDGFSFAGWEIDGTVYSAGSKVTLKGDITATAQWDIIPATAPTITKQPVSLDLTVGYEAGKTLTIAATAENGHELTYQWYSIDADGNATEIANATAASYSIPTGQGVGSYGYYCIVTATRKDNSDTASAISDLATVTVKGKVATPTFSLAEGTHIGTKSVTLSCSTASADIYYTTNGSTPTTGSTKYTGAISVSENITIKAIAVKNDMADSDVASATYTITPATYTLSVSAPTFTAVAYGYTQPAAGAVTISSTGNSAATISGVALDNIGKQYFKLNKETGATIAASATDSTTYTVRPNAGLAVGTYNATITVTYNGGATATADVSFTVNKATPAHTPTQEPNPTSKPGGNGGSDDNGNGDDNGDTPDDKPDTESDNGNGNGNGGTPDDKPNTEPDNGNGNGNGGTPDDKPNTEPDNGNGNDNGDTPDDKPDTEPDNGNGNDNGDTPDDKPDTEPEKTEEQKATEKQAEELVSNMNKTVANSEAGAEMKKVLQDTTDTNKQAAAVDVVNTLNDSLKPEEIAGLSKKDIESAVTNKQKEKAAAEKETTQNGGKVDDPKTPAGTDLLDKSNNVSPALKKANGEFSVKPKFAAPAPLPESDIKKIKEKLANRIGTKEIMSGGIHVNTTEEDKDLDKQATKLEDLIKLIVDTLAKITNTAIGKGAAVTVAGANERGLVLATLLPEITVDADGYYPMEVNLRNVTPGRVLSFWPSADYIKRYAAGEVGEYDAYFLDENDNVVTKVTGDASKMKVVPYLEKGKTYDTAFIAVNATENDLKALETLATELNSEGNGSSAPTSDKGSGGCDAGLGVVGLLALAGLMAARKR